MFQILPGILKSPPKLTRPVTEGANSESGSGAIFVGGQAFWLMLVLALMLIVPITANAQYAYITNNGGNTVSVIDTLTNKVSTTIPVGSRPFGVTATVDAAKVYVTN